MGKKKNVCPPGIYTSKPYTGTEGTQYEEDGMEHLDQEVNTSICTALGQNKIVCSRLIEIPPVNKILLAKNLKKKLIWRFLFFTNL